MLLKEVNNVNTNNIDNGAYLQTLGLKIRSLREEKGMSQTEFAKLLGYNDRSMITKIEQGKVDLTHSKIKIVAKILGVLPENLTSVEVEPEYNILMYVVFKVFYFSWSSFLVILCVKWVLIWLLNFFV